jgi:uncharacterized UBP type Zn finger protein
MNEEKPKLIDRRKRLWVCVTCGRAARARHQLAKECYLRAVNIAEDLCVWTDNRVTGFLGHLEEKE